ncbi:amidase [Leucobacter sp. CSA2]|uniref:Amidase n=1 Tax=Leucobacter edaphi TaxID=2796472 RepID=A0A934Q9E6_9MICO|nr:amidase [Leucobacter edaphi]MBK0420614.1 amidase [Leucobacter edaphi]
MESVSEQVLAMEAGEVSSEELTRRALERAAASGKTFITVDGSALAAAAASDQRRAAGKPLSRIDGVPTAIKDVIDTAGLRTTMASEFFRDNVPESDAEIVTRLRDAGAIIVGKTNAQEFSYGIRGDSGAFGYVPNPYDESRVSGGSSSGSAAAVVQGVVAYSVGSDTAGSVRVPAALCGVAGFKPTLGLIDTAGAFPLSQSFDTLGFLASDAEGIDLVMREAGYLSAPAADGEASVRLTALDDLRAQVADAAPAEAYDAAISRVPAQHGALFPEGSEVFDFDELYRVVRSREAYLIHEDRVERSPERFQPEVLANLRAGAEVTDEEVRSARAEIARARAAMAERFADDELLISPTTPILAPEAGATAASGPLASLTVIWNVLGWPAISIPIWVPGCALPQSIQIIGKPGRDRSVLRAAAALERELRA